MTKQSKPSPIPYAMIPVEIAMQMENEMIEEGKAPTHQMTMKWLEACADKWADDPKIFADYRGFNIMDRQSLTNVPLLEEDKE